MGNELSRYQMKPEVGDIICCNGKFGPYYRHYAIYLGLGDDYVAHAISADAWNWCVNKAEVRIEKLSELANRYNFVVDNHWDAILTPLPKEEIVWIAVSSVGPIEYCVFTKNCEVFVTRCRYGKGMSDQVPMWITAFFSNHTNEGLELEGTNRIDYGPIDKDHHINTKGLVDSCPSHWVQETDSSSSAVQASSTTPSEPYYGELEISDALYNPVLPEKTGAPPACPLTKAKEPAGVKDGQEGKVDVDERKQLLKCSHQSPEGGHNKVSVCTGQSTKALKPAELQPIKVCGPFELLRADLIGPSPETAGDHRYVLTMAKASQDEAHQPQGEGREKRKEKGAQASRFAPGQQVYTALFKAQDGGKMECTWIRSERIVSIEGGMLHLAGGRTVAQKQPRRDHSVLAPFLDYLSTAASSLAVGHAFAVHQSSSACSAIDEPPHGARPSTTPWFTGQHEFIASRDIRPDLLDKARQKLTCPGGINVTPKNLETLEYNNWLDDNIIHAFLGIVAQQQHQHAMVLSIFLADKLEAQESLEPGWFQPELQMSELTWILLPVFTSNHWLLLVVDVKQRLVHILDSAPEEERSKSCFRLWMTFLRKRAEIKRGDLPVEGWRRGDLTSEPQTGPDDCGVYVCMNAESMVNHGHPVQDVNVPAERRYIYKSIVTHGRLLDPNHKD